MYAFYCDCYIFTRFITCLTLCFRLVLHSSYSGSAWFESWPAYRLSWHDLHGFFQSLQPNVRIVHHVSQWRVAFHILYNSLFTNRIIVQQYALKFDLLIASVNMSRINKFHIHIIRLFMSYLHIIHNQRLKGIYVLSVNVLDGFSLLSYWSINWFDFYFTLGLYYG